MRLVLLCCCQQERVFVEFCSSTNQRRLSDQMGGAYIVWTSTWCPVAGADAGHAWLRRWQLSTRLLDYDVQGRVVVETDLITWPQHVILRDHIRFLAVTVTHLPSSRTVVTPGRHGRQRTFERVRVLPFRSSLPLPPVVIEQLLQGSNALMDPCRSNIGVFGPLWPLRRWRLCW